MPRTQTPAAWLLALAVTLAGLLPVQASDPALPPPVGPSTPRVEPVKTDEGVYHQSWFAVSFLNLAEDFSEAKAVGKRFAVVFEQKGCPYCIKMHTDILANKYINDYVRENFVIVQLDLWGSREVTDFDGAKLSEKALAQKYGVRYTPTIQFFPDTVAGLAAKAPKDREVHRIQGYLAPPAFLTMFRFVAERAYEKGSLRDYLKANS